jgi:hypothetical protein
VLGVIASLYDPGHVHFVFLLVFCSAEDGTQGHLWNSCRPVIYH